MFFFAVLLAVQAALAGENVEPKIRVGIVPVEDRWISLSDGSRVYFGQEISYLLGHVLFQSGKFRPVLMGGKTYNFQGNSNQQERIPSEWLDWVQESKNTFQPGSAPVRVDLVVGADVEELTFASGARSNRIVYGFRAGENNPFWDNEFVPQVGQTLSCARPDYFKTQFNPPHGSFRSSNFGSDGDEGFQFFFLGYGFGYKQKKYETVTQVTFHTLTPINQGTRDQTVRLTAKGKDLFLAGSYSQFSLAIEIQRRETLKNALLKVVPELVQLFLNQSLTARWSAQVSEAQGAEDAVIDVGSDDALSQGLRLRSAMGSIFEVSEVFASAARIKKISGGFPAILGEHLFLESEPSPEQLTAHSSKNISAEVTLKDPVWEERALVQKAAVEKLPCFGKKESWIEQTISGLLGLWALWRYKHNFDQPLKTESAISFVPSTGLRVGFLGTGVDYNDPDFKGHVNPMELGFDFLSRDLRSSDDNGQTTAAAKLFGQKAKVPWTLVSLKVVGPRGEIHSAELYEAFQYAAKAKLDALVVPFKPAIISRAYEEGIQLARQSGVKVFVPTFSTQSKPSLSFKTRGLGGFSIKLDDPGVYAVEDAATWANGKKE